MKYFLLFTISIVLLSTTLHAQEAKKSRKEIKADRDQVHKKEINEWISSQNYVFEPSHALPLSGSTQYLNHTFELKITNDSVYSYLPFFGVAYHVDYGSRQSALDFSTEILNYKMANENGEYDIKFETKNKSDLVVFHLNVSELGYSTLHVSSTHRQSITFYGNIVQIKKNE